MATPERDTVYTGETNRTVYTRESSGTGWFVGIIVALALLAIGYLVFSANSGPATTTVDVNNSPAIEAPAMDTTTPATQAPAVDTNTTPAVEAPATPAAEPAPATAPVIDAAPAAEPAPAATPTP